VNLRFLLLRLTVPALLPVFLVGCSCEKKSDGAGPPDAPPALSPLVDIGVPAEVRVEIYPALGATLPRPVELVLAEDAALCQQVRQAARGQTHVLCLPPQLQLSEEGVEALMKEGTQFLREKYKKYVLGSPVHLLTDERYSPLGFRLMLREPSVFAHGYLPGLDPATLTSSLLYALFSGGARTLVLARPLSPEQAPLQQMSKRGGLQVEAVGSGADATSRALALVKARDTRLVGP